jgi:methylphosphotriester-DNA--protein-cysteine methyltransferase
LLLFGGVIIIAVAALVIYGTYFDGNSTLTAVQDVQKVRNSTMMFVASKESNLFHKSTCQYVKQILEKNRVYFMTREEAIKAGKSPCSVCKP